MQKKPKTKRVWAILAILSLGLLFFVVTKGEGQRPQEHPPEVRQRMEPAASAEEWMQRLSLDLEKERWNSPWILNLYAELPPLEEWHKLAAELERFASDQDKVKQVIESGENHFYQDPVVLQSQLLIFSELIKEDGDPEPRIRSLFQDANPSPAARHSLLPLLLAASQDRAATHEWLNSQHPEFLTEESDSQPFSSAVIREKWEIHFAEGRVKEGIETLQETLRSNPQSDLRSQLMQVALVLGREELASEMSEQMKEVMFAQLARGGTYSPDGNLFVWDVHAGQWATIVDDYGKMTKAIEDADHVIDPTSQIRVAYLTALFHLGHSEEFAGQIQLLQEVFHENPEAFLSFLMRQAGEQPKLAIFFLKHLAEQRQTEEAWTYATHLLARRKGEDDFYRFLLELDEERALEFIEALRKYDPFEERPLIWLAETARRNGDPDSAMELIQEAIALDPSDGDHGKNSRMFCYEVLARIHRDTGRDEKAKFFDQVVEAIRQGEVADDYLHVGLIQDATERYQEALGQFEDAYCLQSRLALTLARNGRFKESVKHFRKAFELMPVSFGPRESHCFGCEGLFRDERVLEIAEPLLQQFTGENPDNPRAPYMLGMVLDRMGDQTGAAEAYRKALQLDPQYFNAARNLLELLKMDASLEAFAEVEQLRERMFEIAPYPQKCRYLPEPARLREYESRINEFPPCPLDLPRLPFGVSLDPRSEKQYLKVETDFFQHNYFMDGSMAVDGWSKYELCLQNPFIQLLDTLN